MNRWFYTYTCLVLYLIVVSLIPAFATDSTETIATDSVETTARPVVFTFKLDEDIMPAAGRKVEQAYKQAEEAKADYILLELNTFGGRVDVADEIRAIVMASKATTVVFINNNAASAGALISIAHDSIYMVKGASIGAATVVSTQDGTQLPDKYQSYMRSTMRSTAEAKGRDPKIAEAMVDERIAIEGVIDSGYTLTFTTEEALAHDYTDGRAVNIDDVLEQLGLEDVELIKYQEGSMEGVINFLLHPAVSSLLMMMIFFGMFFELQSPGVGFPLIAAIAGAVLYFAPLYLEGLAANWEILVFVAGVVLIALEVFVIPGFGVAGVSGIILALVGLTLSLIGNIDFDFSFAPDAQILWAIIRVTLTVSIIILLFLAFNEKLIKSGAFSRLVLVESLSDDAGYTSSIAGLDQLIGLSGTAVTDLRPVGKVEINDERYEASSDGELIEKGNAITVVRSRGNFVEVKRAK